MDMCACPECGLPAEVLADRAAESYRAVPRPNDLVLVRCLDQHWSLGDRQTLLPAVA